MSDRPDRDTTGPPDGPADSDDHSGRDRNGDSVPDRATDGKGRRATPETTETGAEVRVGVDWDVPPEASPHVCERCGRPFADSAYRDLHRGLAHWEDLTDDERTAYWAAVEAEREALRRFRLLALGALVLLYFGFLILYAVFT
jgi:hypothetical protein